jgi:site-specific recombinase
MLYYFAMFMAAVGAGVLIAALTFVTLMLTGIIMSMFAFTAAPVLDKVLKD